MESNFNKLASELYKKIQAQFNNITIANQYAERLNKKDDIPNARFFEFEYKENGRPYGTVAINLDNDDGLVVQLSGDLTSEHSKIVRKNIYDFIRSLREFARKHLVNFNVRNIGKRNLDQRDYTFQAKRKEYAPMPPIMENKLYGSNKISYQDLGEARLIIKHSQPINTDYAAGRSQHIQNIYIENVEGERFKYPFKHLNGARALAEHIKHGGNPYDAIGRHITGLSEELAHLRKFKNYVGRQDQISEAMGSVSDRVMERIENIKKQVNQLQRSAYYEEFAESFVAREERIIPEELINDWVDRLTIRTFNEELKGVFPYLYELIDESELPVKTLNPDDLLGENSVEEGYNTRLFRGKITDRSWAKYADQLKEIDYLAKQIDSIWASAKWDPKFQVDFKVEKDAMYPKVVIHFIDQLYDPERSAGTPAKSIREVLDFMTIMANDREIYETLLRLTPGHKITFGYEQGANSIFISFLKNRGSDTDFVLNTFMRGGYETDSSNEPIMWINKTGAARWRHKPKIDQILRTDPKLHLKSGNVSDTEKQSQLNQTPNIGREYQSTDLEFDQEMAAQNTMLTPGSAAPKPRPGVWSGGRPVNKLQYKSGTRFEENIESILESFMESLLNKNTGIFNPDPTARRDAIDKLNELLSRKLLAGSDGMNARNSLKDIIDDPVFLESLRDINPNLDVRSLIQDYILENSPELAAELKFEPSAETPPTETEPVPEPAEMPASSQVPGSAEIPSPELGGAAPMPTGAPGEAPVEELPSAPGAPIAERFNLDANQNFKLRTRPKFTFGNRRKLELKNMLKKAQRAGATLETVMNIGQQPYTIEDIISECGFSIEECGFSKANGVDEILEFANSFWNDKDKNFTIGSTRLKTKIAKEFEEGRFKNATTQDVEEAFSEIESRDPSSNEHNRMLTLANVPQRGPYLSRELDSREKELGEVVAAMQESAADTMKKFIDKINLGN